MLIFYRFAFSKMKLIYVALLVGCYICKIKLSGIAQNVALAPQIIIHFSTVVGNIVSPLKLCPSNVNLATSARERIPKFKLVVLLHRTTETKKS